MPLYDRLMGLNRPTLLKIPIHQFSALLAEFARGQITGAQAQDAITAISGAPLSAAEVTEAQTLLATISGSATAKLARAKEIDDVLMVAEMLVVYTTPEGVKTRLGV
jgi:hypothetical protein